SLCQEEVLTRGLREKNLIVTVGIGDGRAREPGYQRRRAHLGVRDRTTGDVGDTSGDDIDVGIGLARQHRRSQHEAEPNKGSERSHRPAEGDLLYNQTLHTGVQHLAETRMPTAVEYLHRPA